MLRKSVIRFISVCAILLPAIALEAQNRLEISTGVGFFDGVFVKAKYGNRLEIGISQDLVSQLHTTGLEIYYRIPRRYEPANPGPFYIMCGFSTTFFGKGYDTFEKSFIYPRMGRSFILSRRSGRAGLNIDLGVSFLRSTNPPGDYITDFIPFSGSAGFFYRF
ncbi:MAG: hypothetical protein MUE37_00125 [Bacteroidales bacterium]|jgi:hypothetical protein|nr:hypothetical protein [Bacteroidales bacterium]